MIGINLIDESVLAARRRRRHLRRWLMVLLATAGAAAFPVGLEVSRQQRVQSLKKEKGVLNAHIESSRSKLSAMGMEIRALQAQAARADALRRKRPWSQLLRRVAEVMPQELWLVSLSTVPAAPVGGHKNMIPEEVPANAPFSGDPKGERSPKVVTMEAPRALTFEGYALAHGNLYEFMSRLKDTNLFTDISLTRAYEEAVLTAEAVRFKIECRW